MKRLLIVCMVISMLGALLLPAVATAKPSSPASLDGVEIVKKMPAKGLGSVGNLTTGTGKPFSISGYVGEPVTGNRYAIVIGISDYPGEGSVLEGGMDLFYGDDDAYAVSATLLGVYGFDAVYTFVDSDASRTAILAQITALQSIVTADDEVVFYFSGHGAKYTASMGGKVGIVTWGYEDLENGIAYPEVIWDNELNSAFQGFATDRIIFGFDCCMAGGMAELGNAKGRIVVMATDRNGISAEYGQAYESIGAVELPDIGWINGGLFTYFFVTQGLTYGIADFYPPDGVVTVEEAFSFAQYILTQFSAENPQLDEIPTIRDNFEGDLQF